MRLRAATLVKFPAKVDCNSPAHWDGDRLYLFNSAPEPWRSSGKSVFDLGQAVLTRYQNKANGGRWIEATYKDDDGTLYGWYHNEPHPVCPAREALTAPRIGAALSHDNGGTWQDLGFVLEAPADSLFCETENHYFAGGNGDFCVNLDSRKEYFYFFIGTYHRDSSEQGVAVARVPYTERQNPAGKPRKWYRGQWSEPGAGGHVTPIFPVKTDWNHKDADAFWGASVHWNSHLNLEAGRYLHQLQQRPGRSRRLERTPKDPGSRRDCAGPRHGAWMVSAGGGHRRRAPRDRQVGRSHRAAVRPRSIGLGDRFFQTRRAGRVT
ncbi:MAG: hypothetical protein DMG08_11755 [Acidobacteria bacterium]|nr:MAG: hypothetical protein DMG08_11755 [Acidobacteriota bacterium]